MQVFYFIHLKWVCGRFGAGYRGAGHHQLSGEEHHQSLQGTCTRPGLILLAILSISSRRTHQRANTPSSQVSWGCNFWHAAESIRLETMAWGAFSPLTRSVRRLCAPVVLVLPRIYRLLDTIYPPESILSPAQTSNFPHTQEAAQLIFTSPVTQRPVLA